MSGTYLTLTNSTLARLNEVQLTSSNISAARGIQIQAQNAVNEAIRYVNQKEYNFPFNHATETKTLTAVTVTVALLPESAAFVIASACPTVNAVIAVPLVRVKVFATAIKSPVVVSASSRSVTSIIAST